VRERHRKRSVPDRPGFAAPISGETILGAGGSATRPARLWCGFAGADSDSDARAVVPTLFSVE